MRKFKYNMFDEITSPTLILSTKYHKHIGSINNVGSNIASDFNMASHQEISFDVYKTLDGEPCTLWDQIVDFKYLYVPEHNEYYELTVSIDDADNTIKHCVGISAGEQELSQRYLRDFHCNDETDILMDDYVVTVFYNPNDPKGSLLDRVLHDKCPDWSIGHVDGTIANIQRTFTADNTTIYDFLVNTVATEIGCLFKFDSVNKKINVYDLKNTCADKCNNCEYVGFINETCPKCGSSNIDHGCGFRGEFTDKCPKCGKKHYIRSYGAWKNVYVSPENTALQITVDGDSESVKNCFKIVGGDDLMTATVVNINPNHSSYIYRFSDDMKADMPTELVKRLDEYEAEYRNKLDTYTDLTNKWYDEIDQVMEYQTRMMPETPIPQDTTAKTQLDNLVTTVTDEHFAVSVQDINHEPTETDKYYNNAVEGYAKVLVDPRYTVEVSDGVISSIDEDHRTWTGKFTVKSLGGLNAEGKEDIAITPTAISLVVNDDFENFLQQKIQKSLDRKDAAFTTIFNIENDNEFKAALKLYSLDRLSSFSNTYQSVLEILIKQGVSDLNSKVYTQTTYDEVYVPYYNRKGWIDTEMGVRESEVATAQAAADTWDEKRKKIQTDLDLETYLGEDLYKIFVLYLREDTYSNSNYISDGLDNAEEIEKARELFTVAESELIKASELQFTLTGQLANFLNTEEFKDFKGEFEIGDWIICKADDHIYRLRIVNVNYSYDDPGNIQITFSNVVRGGTFMSDVASILSKAGSMATSYNYVAHQANQGNNASNVIDGMLEDGVNTGVFNIIAGNNQDVIIDEHGITAKEYDDVEMAYSPKQLKITSRYIAFTDDNWEHSSLGIGEQEYSYWDAENQELVTDIGYGLISRFIDSAYIKGSQIIAGDIYSNNYTANGVTGAHISLDDGKFTFADGKLKFDGTDLYIQGDVIVGSRIEDATIVDGTININDTFIVDEDGDVTLNGTVSGTAWATKQDKLVVNPVGTATDTIQKLEIDNVVYDFDSGSNVEPNPVGTATQTLTKLGIDNIIYSLDGTGNANYAELFRDEYEALTYDEKNNDTIYFVKDIIDVEIPPEGMEIGEYYNIQNSRLNPSYQTDWIRWYFNQSDAEYIYNIYGINNPNYHPPYGVGWGSNTNFLITDNMPIDTCYVLTLYGTYGLSVRTLIFIPKEIIDDGIGCMTRNGFYSTEDFEYYSITFWGDWSDPSNYQTITTNIFDSSLGIHHIQPDFYSTTERLSFCNIPYLVGHDFVNASQYGRDLQESLDTYLADKSYSEYPYFYDANYFMYNNIMPLRCLGTVYLNDVDYTDRISELVKDVQVDGVSVVDDGIASIDLSNKQDILTAGVNINIDSNTNTISATDTNTIDGLTDVSLSSPSDGDTLIYDINSQKWINSAGGGGGTIVVANPVGTPTDDLDTIQIGNTIYDIVGSSGSGGTPQTISDILWSGSTTPSTTGISITLNHAISNYDFIIFTITQGDGYDSVITIPTSELTIGDLYINTGYGGSQMDIFFDYVSDTSLNIKSSASAHPTTYKQITGLKICGTLAPMIYSLEEREVGVWVDNKPLYQKTYINVASSGQAVNVTLSDLSDIETIFIVPQGSASTDEVPFPYVHYSTANLIGGFFTLSNGVPTLSIRRGSDMANVGLKYLTVCYTKITDVAGSGNYGTLGVPMVHYDDTEKVVGTWFGETVYEKSAVGIFSTGTLTVMTLDSNIDTLISYDAVIYYPPNNQWLKLPYAESGDYVFLLTVGNQVRILSNSGMSSYSKYAVTVRYTKATT